MVATKTKNRISSVLTAEEKNGTNRNPQERVAIIIPRPDIREWIVQVEGLSPLLVNRWSEKAMRQMAEAQSGAPKTRKRLAREPENEFKASLYEYPGGGWGFPANAFKQAAVAACRGIDGLTMTKAKQLLICPQELVKIEGPDPKMDIRPVRLANGSADLRYRGIFHPWSCSLVVRFNAGATTAEQIGNLLVLAGETVGIGEMRPEKGHNYGRFTIR